ncbi:acyl-CoA dehydrogenase family protein [Methylocapsa sp. S129]|uniref:acyl-CoA dehydrogenase family protein n=1 Tax=Methylocapsa sp. S129 TaxID=1641869 RepID=UPI00131E1841|nr:acyl-CoA dehydrogenase [Methylocapsa sp. S129]
MNFDLTEEQQLLKDSVTRLLADRYSFENRKTFQASPDGWSRDLWRQYAEIGLLGVAFSEADGGFGGGPVETMLISEAFGKALALEPYLATIVLAGGLIRRGGDAEQRAALIPSIASGELLLAFAHAERQSGHDLFDVGASAKKDGASFVLNGEKGLVLHGDCADKLIVSARSAGARRDKAGIGLFLVDAKADGVSRRGYPTQDGMRAAEVTLTNVRVEPKDVLAANGDALPLIERIVDEAIAASSAEAVGAMSEALDMTVDYLKTRKQFGVPIGSFQALQHRASDMVVALEQARSMMMLATMMSAEENAAERRKAISAAKVQIGRSARFIGQQSIQLHGGIGMTMEYKLGHLFKRLTMIDILFGDADYHLERLSKSDGLIG